MIVAFSKQQSKRERPLPNTTEAKSITIYHLIHFLGVKTDDKAKDLRLLYEHIRRFSSPLRP